MNFAKILAGNRVKILTQKDRHKILNISKQIDSIETTNLNDIKGVGESTIKKLLENRISSQEELKKLDDKEIKKMKLNFLSEKALLKFIK